MDNIIELKSISKSYKISHEYEKYVALRDRLAHPLLALKNSKIKKEDFWALKDVSFNVKKGEAIGLIGPNGSGKSTLLKILSRVTPPTKGEAIIRGKIASLLEIGTGFHSELTGRENIYLSGVILGMSHASITKHFDEIVSFAGVEKFLDTPVKRYSSGMMVRLGFAVAAHLNPDVLFVDEVLAVGDENFQKKCLGKMNEITKGEGRTIIFVSHNMTAIRNLCSIGVYLKDGEVKMTGQIDKVIEYYMSTSQVVDSGHIAKKIRLTPGLTNRAKIIDFQLQSENKINPVNIDSSKPVTIKLTVEAFEDVRLGAYVNIKDLSQALIWLDSAILQRCYFDFKKGQRRTIILEINPTNLVTGNYRIDCGLEIPSNNEWIDLVQDAYFFSVPLFDPYQSGFNLNQSVARYNVGHHWEIL